MANTKKAVKEELTMQEKEMKFIFPEEKFTIAEVEFTLRPFSFKETANVVENLKGCLHIFSGDATEEGLAELYYQNFEGIRNVIAMSLHISPKIVEEFDQVNLIKAITYIIQVNKSFFSSNVQTEVENLTKIFTDEDKPTSAK